MTGQMDQITNSEVAVVQPDWLWSIIICPECGGPLVRGEEAGKFVCANRHCGFSSEQIGRVFNLLPRMLDQQQIAENTWRKNQLEKLARLAPHMNESQRATFMALDSVTGYLFTSQYAFFRDYFVRAHALRGRGLEIGGGTGHCSGFIKLFYPGIDMVTSDVAPINMELAEKLARRLQFATDYFVLADAQKLPFIPDCYDFIFSSGMLHHVGDLPRTLKSGYKVLKPGGRWYVINELSIGSIPRAYWNSRWGSKGKWGRMAGIRENSYTFKEWIRFFEAARFTIVDVKFHTNPKHKLQNWSRAAYYALISRLPAFALKLGIPCEVNFVLEKR
jgi:ubiquinone/menaquinone biosynthesis C-methylase UbiE